MTSFGRGSVGTAYVTILADTSRFGEDLRRGIAADEADIRAAGELIDDAYSEGVISQAKKNEGRIADAVLSFAEARGRMDANARSFAADSMDTLRDALTLEGHGLGEGVTRRIFDEIRKTADSETAEMRIIMNAMNAEAIESARAAADEQLAIQRAHAAASKQFWAQQEQSVTDYVGHLEDWRHGSLLAAEAEITAQKMLSTVTKNLEQQAVALDRGGASIRRFRGEMEKTFTVLKNWESGTKLSTDNTRLLVEALISVAPALVPIGAAAIAGIGVLGSVAAVAGLAIFGLVRNMKEATDIGKQANSVFRPVVDTFKQLGDVAAKAVLPGLAQGISAAAHDFGALTPLVNSLAGSLGRITGNVGASLISMFVQLGPLTKQFAGWLENVSVSLLNWAQGQGFQDFLGYVNANMPAVIAFFREFGKAIISIVDAAGPLGGTTLKAFTLLLEVISAIPGPLLTVALGFLQLGTMMKYVNKAAEGVSTIMGDLGLKTLKSKEGLAELASKLTLLTNPFILAGVAAISFYQIISGHTQDVVATLGTFGETMKQQLGSLSGAFKQSGGVIDESVNQIVASFAASPEMSQALKDAGLSVTDLGNALAGSKDDWDHFSRQITTSGKEGGKLIFNMGALKESFDNAKNAGLLYAEALKVINSVPLDGKSKTDALSLQHVASNLGITTDAATKYAATLGITNDMVKTGALTNQQLQQSIQTVGAAYANANESQNEYLSAVNAFAASGGSAAGRAAMIGATLKNANGDLLSFTGAMAGAYSAIRNLTDNFDANQRAAVDWNTGLIDASKEGAPELITALSGIQNAAMKAAEATFLHEKATVGGKQAADDAYAVYKSKTSASLIDQATKLGITSAQAQLLADKYFGMPEEVKTQLEAIGQDPIVTALDKIGQMLAHVFGQPWTTTVSANTTPADTHLSALDKKLTGYENRVTTTTVTIALAGTVNVDNKLAQYANRMKGGLATGIPGKMAGGLVGQEQIYRVGEIGMREAIIPLDLPMSKVSPDVRAMAQLLRDNGYGKATGINSNKPMVVNVFPVQADPVAVAESVLNRAVADARF